MQKLFCGICIFLAGRASIAPSTSAKIGKVEMVAVGGSGTGIFFGLDKAGVTTLNSFASSTAGPVGDLIFSDGIFYRRTSYGRGIREAVSILRAG